MNFAKEIVFLSGLGGDIGVWIRPSELQARLQVTSLQKKRNENRASGMNSRFRSSDSKETWLLLVERLAIDRIRELQNETT